MKRGQWRVSPYLLVFFLPVLLVLLVATGIVFTSLYSIRQEYQGIALAHKQDTDRLALAGQFTHDLAAIQLSVAETLEQASSGRVDEASTYRAHTDIVNKLAALEKRLQELTVLQANSSEVTRAREDFETYRQQVISATDMAAIDPSSAMRDAFRASKTYIAFSEHTHTIAKEAIEAMGRRSGIQAENFQAYAQRLAVMGFVSLLALFLLWFVVLRKMLNRMRLLAGTLEAVVGSTVDPSVWGEMEKIGQEPRSLFSGSARALLAYRETVAARAVAQAQRDEAQTLMNAVFEQAVSAINLIDAQSLRLMRINAASVRILGYSREELLGMSLADLQVDLDLPALQARVQEVLRAGSANFENRYRCRDGREIDVRIEVSALRQQGRDYLVAMWDDVTERKQAELTLRKLSMAVEQSPHAVVITDMAANIEIVNDAFTDLTGYHRAEVLGRNPRLLSSGKTPAATYEQMWRALTAGQQWRGTFINRTKDGRERVE